MAALRESLHLNLEPHLGAFSGLAGVHRCRDLVAKHRQTIECPNRKIVKLLSWGLRSTTGFMPSAIHPDLDKLTKKSSVFQGNFFLYDLLFQNFQIMKYSIGRYPSNKVLYIVVGKLKWLLERKDQNKLIEVWVYTLFFIDCHFVVFFFLQCYRIFPRLKEVLRIGTDLWLS